MDRSSFALLLTPEGRALLDGLPAYDEDTALADAERLRRSAPAELATVALSQSRLRARADAKFGTDAAAMFFTAAGVEQATRRPVAEHRAARFVAAGLASVADLGAGIGGDAIALARAGLGVLAVERDGLTADVLRANASALGLADRIRVLEADATRTDLAGWDAVFCDPARRTARGRVFDPRAYAPPWPFVAGLLGGGRPAAVKVAPGLPHDLVPAGVEAEWVSWSGEVKEAALWSGPLAGDAPRRATLLPSGAVLAGRPEPGTVRGVGQFLYEPDGAVIRAGLVGAVADAIGGGLLDPTIAYVTGDRLVATPFATAYEVVEVLPFGLKRLRAALVAQGVGRVVVKKRGTAVEPDELRRRLKLRGGKAEAVVILTRVAGAQTALICRRAPADSPPPDLQSI